MVTAQDKAQKRGRVPSALFGVGAVFLCIEAGAYLIGMDSPGIMFVIGMVLLLLGALTSAFSDKEKPKAEDLVTVALGACFFIWLGWRTFLQ